MIWLMCTYGVFTKISDSLLITQRSFAKYSLIFHLKKKHYRLILYAECYVIKFLVSGSFSVPLASVMYLNSMSVTWTARIQTFLSFSKLLAIAIIIVPGMYQLFKGMSSSSSPSSSSSSSSSLSSSSLHLIAYTSTLPGLQQRSRVCWTFRHNPISPLAPIT